MRWQMWKLWLTRAQNQSSQSADLCPVAADLDVGRLGVDVGRVVAIGHVVVDGRDVSVDTLMM